MGRRTLSGVRTTHSADRLDQSGMGIFSWLHLVRDEFFQMEASVNTRMGWRGRRDGRMLILREAGGSGRRSLYTLPLRERETWQLQKTCAHRLKPPALVILKHKSSIAIL